MAAIAPHTRNNRSKEPVWQPQAGSQYTFLSCPIFEVLFEGTRGGGKTDCLIMDFLQHVGVGWGVEWRGILFRQSFPQLADVIKKCRKWIPQMFPGATYNKADHTWTFPGGEELLLRHIDDPEDYWNYHGHEYPWIGWEELTNWATPDCYKRMMSCCRSSVSPDRKDINGNSMPRKYRATTNPYGPGHNWIKKRFKLPHMRGLVLREMEDVDGNKAIRPRVALHSSIEDNKLLLAAEPEYIETIRQAARNKAEEDAWIRGSWDITSGGMFDDIWDATQHVVQPFDIPASWKMTRSFDWGSAKPFSVGWWAESDGTDFIRKDGTRIRTVKGDKFRVAEWYGCGKEPNQGIKLTAAEISAGIIEKEIELGFRPKGGKSRVRPGAADSAIWDSSGGPSIATQMNQGVRLDGRVYSGLMWEPADKSPGSRKNGWEAIRDRLKAALRPEGGGPREKPGLFVFNTCKSFIELVPIASRDEKNPDDIDTDTEDHIADETRYEIMTPRRVAKVGSSVGHY